MQEEYSPIYFKAIYLGLPLLACLNWDYGMDK